MISEIIFIGGVSTLLALVVVGFIDTKDYYGKTALFKAVESGNIDMVKMLIALGANPNISWRRIDNGYVQDDRISPLVAAAKNGDVEIIKLLLQVEGIDLDGALAAAVKFNHIDVVAMLLKVKGIDVNKQIGIYGDALLPLGTAARDGLTEIAALLLQVEGIDVNAKYFDGHPLRQASRNGHVEIVSMLLKAKGIDVNNNYGRWTGLGSAAWQGHMEIVKMYLQIKGIDVYASGALRNAALSGHTAIVDLLLETILSDKSIDLNNAPPLSDEREPPIWVAVEFNNPKMVMALVEAGLDVNLFKDPAGNTPLHKCCESGNAEMVSTLIACNASLTEKNNQDQLPIDVATSDEIKELINNEMAVRFDHGLKRAVV